MANALVSIQIIPKLNNTDDTFSYVDAAIEVIEEAKITYRVHPLETTMEGELSELLRVIEKMNERMMEMGAVNVISQVKIAYQPEGIRMETLTEKYE